MNVMNKLLTQIETNRAKVVVIDVTGVQAIDSQVSHHLIQMIRAIGLMGSVAIITGRKSIVVQRRARELGIKDVYQKCLNKMSAYQKLTTQYSLSDREIAYMGDDIVDAPIMRRVGLPVAVADADEQIKKYALLITRKAGGRGAVREVTDFILKAKKLWKRMFDEYFSA